MRRQHRTRVSRTGEMQRPWRVTCTCGSETTWMFWPNAINRAHRHLLMPGVYP